MKWWYAFNCIQSAWWDIMGLIKVFLQWIANYLWIYKENSDYFIGLWATYAMHIWKV